VTIFATDDTDLPGIFAKEVVIDQSDTWIRFITRQKSLRNEWQNSAWIVFLFALIGALTHVYFAVSQFISGHAPEAHGTEN